jgi:hypothetical protein
MILYKNSFAAELATLPAADFVTECYRMILGRKADATGLMHHLERTMKGEDRVSIAAKIAESDEAAALPSSRKRVVGEILAMHAAQLAEGATTPEDWHVLMRRLDRYFKVLAPSSGAGWRVTGEDGTSRDPLSALSDSDFILECYRSILRRAPDPQGLAEYVARVARGEDRLSIAAEMASSDEAHALPGLRKGVAGAVLAQHAAVLATKAMEADESSGGHAGRVADEAPAAGDTSAGDEGASPDERAELIERIKAYFAVLSYSATAPTSTAEAAPKRQDGDPFSDYLQSVIQTGVQNADIR